MDDRKKIGILVVDDDESMRGLLFLMLSRAGYRVILAEDGEKALRLFAGGHSVSLVMTDQCMPKMDGFTLAAKVKAAAPEIPIIMVTGSRIHEGCETNWVDYIIFKPFQLGEFYQTVEMALRGVNLQPRTEQGVEIHIQG